jgi:dipeptidyl-peptidase 4
VRGEFPRQLARTRRFSLGVPRAFTATADGTRLRFLRTRDGRDPVSCLWELDLESGAERLLVDPATLVEDGPQAETDEQRALRERTRELADGITGYAADDAGDLLAFVSAGRLWTWSATHGARSHPAASVFDPRPSPDGTAVAVVHDGGLGVLEVPAGRQQPGEIRPIVSEEGVRWGVAEFVAAEEMGRTRGHWWAPDGRSLLAARVDERAVSQWWLSDPSDPTASPRPHRYPAAGAANADVRLAIVPLDPVDRVEVTWDRERFEYVTRVRWDRAGDGADRLIVQVQSRDQRTVAILGVDPATGVTRVVAERIDPHHPIELVAGSPAWWDTRLVTVEDLADHGPGGSRALLIDGEVATSPGLQVRAVAHADADAVWFTASGADPSSVEVWRIDGAGPQRMTGTQPGVHRVEVAASRPIVSSATPHEPGVRVTVGMPDAAGARDLDVRAERPVVTPRPRWLTLGDRELRAALLLPQEVGEGPLPVVLDPYGGPHAQRVVASANALAGSQWLADNGFAVLVVDGRGTPGRGPDWERAVHGDLAGPVLEDQLDALYAAAALEPRLDLMRVGIRGWSFGGYLAALAALRVPSVVRAAVVGAPVIDWHLYDTHYTERYLGDPWARPDAYARSSLVTPDGRLAAHATPDAGAPSPRLLLIHGLADDNVVAAHSLRLSAALLAAGIDHRFVPLPRGTHMPPNEVAARLLELEVVFLVEALGVGAER